MKAKQQWSQDMPTIWKSNLIFNWLNAADHLGWCEKNKDESHRVWFGIASVTQIRGLEEGSNGGECCLVWFCIDLMCFPKEHEETNVVNNKFSHWVTIPCIKWWVQGKSRRYLRVGKMGVFRWINKFQGDFVHPKGMLGWCFPMYFYSSEDKSDGCFSWKLFV